MKTVKLVMALAMLLFCLPAMAQIKPCEELKSEIEAKLQAQGVASYTLDIVTTEEAQDPEKLAGRKVVGSCNGGQNKILYKRGESTPEGN